MIAFNGVVRGVCRLKCVIFEKLVEQTVILKQVVAQTVIFHGKFFKKVRISEGKGKGT